jgi:hypothetical protein
VKRYGDARRGIIKTDEEYAEEERKAKEKQKQEDDGSLYTTIYRPLPNVLRIFNGPDDTGEKYVTSPYGKCSGRPCTEEYKRATSLHQHHTHATPTKQPDGYNWHEGETKNDADEALNVRRWRDMHNGKFKSS